MSMLISLRMFRSDQRLYLRPRRDPSFLLKAFFERLRNNFENMPVRVENPHSPNEVLDPKANGEHTKEFISVRLRNALDSTEVDRNRTASTEFSES
nr:hypothetical protein [Caballeronia pedi]